MGTTNFVFIEKGYIEIVKQIIKKKRRRKEKNLLKYNIEWKGQTNGFTFLLLACFIISMFSHIINHGFELKIELIDDYCSREGKRNVFLLRRKVKKEKKEHKHSYIFIYLFKSNSFVFFSNKCLTFDDNWID